MTERGERWEVIFFSGKGYSVRDFLNGVIEGLQLVGVGKC
jgi:hypothetical protein